MANNPAQNWLLWKIWCLARNMSWNSVYGGFWCMLNADCYYTWYLLCWLFCFFFCRMNIVLHAVDPLPIISTSSVIWLNWLSLYWHIVLWHCWLVVMMSIRPVKIELWGVDVVICLERGADCLHMAQLMPLHPQTPSSLASFKSRLVFPFWYWLTQVVMEKKAVKRV